MNKKLINIVMIMVLSVSTIVAKQYNPDEKMIRRINQAVCILQDFEQAGMPIPRKILANCKGVVILEVDKGGFFVSGTGGSGIAVLRTPRGWSAPCSVSTGALGFGPQIGVKNEKLVLILNNEEAVEAFSQDDKFAIGSEITMTAGPEHESAEYLTTSPADVYVYRLSDGFFSGASVSANIMSADKEINYLFYGRLMTPEEIMSENMPRPVEARPLYEALNKVRTAKSTFNPMLTSPNTRPYQVVTPPKRTYEQASTANQNAYNARPDTIDLPKPGYEEAGVIKKSYEMPKSGKSDACDVYPTGNNWVQDNDKQAVKPVNKWPNQTEPCDQVAPADSYWYDQQSDSWQKWPHSNSPCDEKTQAERPLKTWPHLNENVPTGTFDVDDSVPSTPTKSRYYNQKPGNNWEPATGVHTESVY